ncbi:DUF1214 domain-containing protein [bacterium]|nr:DUF1214 domain-containing protein [bacterium]
MQTFCASMILWAASLFSADTQTIPVNVTNFCRAETDEYLARFVKQGALGTFVHERELTPIDKQTVIRMNRDTLYSFGVFDLDASPVTVTMPDAGKRYMAIQVVNEDHYALDVIYKPGDHQFTKEQIGTRYLALFVRIFVNPNDPADVKQVHALQDALMVKREEKGKLDIPNWDPVSHKKMRDALLGVVAANGGIDSARMFGRKDQVDEVQHLLGTAAGWGGNPAYAAIYVGAVPKIDDGKTAYQLTVKDVPVDGFWSVSVYNKEGFFQKNPENAYTINNVTAKRNSDGSVTIHFGGDPKATNYLPIVPGWNYTVRLYRPRPEILDGKWKFPEATPVTAE